MKCAMISLCIAFCLLSAGAGDAIGAELKASGWLHWRGPQQDGTSTETGLPDRWRPAGENHLWTHDLAGRGTAVVGRYLDEKRDRVFVWGYRGQGSDVVEVLTCLDANDGKVIWQRQFSDFISDIIYNRYSIGAPTVDPQTGNVYLMTSPGLLVALDRDGKLLWQLSMMERFGRLTFPNGRTGAPAVDGDLVIVNTISTNWGREGPGRNRFYAFDKTSGELVWSSTPGVGPPFLKDSSFSSPVFDRRAGMRVFYAGTGCGNVVAVNARTGEPLWRYQLAIGGVNATMVIDKGHGRLIAIHGKENTDDTGRGRMVAIDLHKAFESHGEARDKEGYRGPFVLDRSHETWRNDDLSMFTSSPVVAGEHVYQVTVKGDLVCVDVATGETVWHKKLGADQLHASPLYADGKLYVPMWHDGLYIIKPGKQDARILDHVKLDGACIGSPAVWNGRIFLHTTEKLYCFGRPGERSPKETAPSKEPLRLGVAPAKVQVIPAEVLMRPGDRRAIRLRGIDELGQDLGAVAAGTWSKYIAPTAKAGGTLDGDFDERGELVAGAGRSAGTFQVDVEGHKGYLRGRILPSPPYIEDFESFDLTLKRKDGTPFAHPPLPWIGARLKWRVQQRDGNNILAKTLERWLFQRSTVFIGHPDDRNYTVTADVMSDGNRLGMSDVGLINQRYIIVLRGNAQRLEVNSNIDRLYEKASIEWEPKTWYRLKTRVDVGEDGAGVVRAKVWPREGDEPQEWTMQVPVKRAHRNGSPGLFGFTPNIKFAVYVDNITVTPND